MRKTYFVIEWGEYDNRQHLFNIYALAVDMDISESSGYRDFEWAIELNRLSLELVGIWPKPDGIVKRRLGPDIRVGFSFIMIVFVSGIPLLHALMRVWGDMPLMIDNLRVTLPMFGVSLELLIMRWKQPVLSSIVNMIAEDWLTLKLSAQRDIMIKHARISRLIIICGSVIFVSVYILVVVLPYFNLPVRHLTNLTDRKKPLPLQTYYVYDTDKSLQFQLTFLAQAIAVLITIVIHLGVNTFLGFLIFHICGQLENFKYQLFNLVSCKDFNRALSSSIVTHLRLMR
ncbi:uncharacterized protein LOC114938767 [Nylanderia fulva]|uniref:uncharacterized protein LOC114938767 n=1 Tax=Nylanderia fulva TaxID=613905 RepID=UPI0010FB6D23|nr:uncharacterized protein LOC114938767 [Nylanderia fulva]